MNVSLYKNIYYIILISWRLPNQRCNFQKVTALISLLFVVHIFVVENFKFFNKQE